LVIASNAAWQIGAAELANVNFREDIRDLAAQAGTNIGLVQKKSDDDITRTVIDRALSHGIGLEPSQVTVRRTDSGPTTRLYLAADYSASAKLPLLTLKLHFRPSSER
jgi:hypothetical protein